jgi:DNA-directed RNA polymerase subunit K/omega
MNKHITSELAAAAAGGRYDLVLIAANRVRELRYAQGTARVPEQQTDISTVLLEIEQGHVGREYLDRKFDPPTQEYQRRRR